MGKCFTLMCLNPRPNLNQDYTLMCPNPKAMFSELNKMRDSLTSALQTGISTTSGRIVLTMNGFDESQFNFMSTIQLPEIRQEIFLRSMLSQYLSKNEGI